MRTVLPRPQVSPGPGKGARRGGRGPGRPPLPRCGTPRPGPRPRVAPGVWLFNPSRRALRSGTSRTCCPISVNTIKLGKCPRSQRFPMSGAGLGEAIPLLAQNPSRLGSVAVPASRRASAGPGPAGRPGGTFPRVAEPLSRFLRVSHRISAARDLRTRAPPAAPRTRGVTEPHAHSHATRLVCHPARRRGSPREKGGKTPTPQPPVPFVALFFGTIKVKLIDSYY